jgi:hypothetical protein
MIKRPTWILLVLLALFLVAYFLLDNRRNSSATGSTPTALKDNYLFSTVDGTLKSLKIIDKDKHFFQMQRDSTGTWMITLPTNGAADQGLASAAETQVGALRILTTLDDRFNLTDTGLDFPSYTVELTFRNNFKHVIEVGNLTPIGNGYYVRLDGKEIHVISQAGIEALVSMIYSPPFPATETPVQSLNSKSTLTLQVGINTPTFFLLTETPTP